MVITTAKQYMLTFSKPIHKDFNVCLNVLFHDGSFSNEIASDQLKTRFRGSLTATNCARSPKTFYNFVRKHYIYSAGLPCHLHKQLSLVEIWDCVLTRCSLYHLTPPSIIKCIFIADTREVTVNNTVLYSTKVAQ